MTDMSDITFAYRTSPHARAPQASSTHETIEKAAEAILRSIPARFRPDSDELLALRVGQRLVMPEGRNVERVR